TEHYLNKKALELAYTEKNEILDGITDAFYTLDENYNFTYLNRHSLDIMDSSLDELIGRNLFEVFPELGETIFKIHLDEVKETGESSKFEFYYDFYNTWFDERIYKTPIGFSVFFVDISLKKNFSLQLETAYAKHKEILESITDSFIAVDTNFCFTYINKEAQYMFDLDAENLLGRKIDTAFSDHDIQLLKPKFKKTIIANHPQSFEFFSDRNDIWFYVNTYPTETGLSAFLRDITDEKNYEIELKKLNQSLKQKNEELEQFAFIASHDLQEPLRIISSFLELLKKHLDNKIDETSEKYIDYSIEGSLRMKQIITDLLDYSRAGRDNESQNLVDCNLLIEEVKGLLEESINSKDATIQYNDLPTVQYNRT
ncbi:MAG: PAS domain S-box protein, partial [Nitrososphaeraceae archaeon]|nr:PAS domain S-box protein [Nitrososphaeraceae archaeon]